MVLLLNYSDNSCFYLVNDQSFRRAAVITYVSSLFYSRPQQEMVVFLSDFFPFSFFQMLNKEGHSFWTAYTCIQGQHRQTDSTEIKTIADHNATRPRLLSSAHVYLTACFDHQQLIRRHGNRGVATPEDRFSALQISIEKTVWLWKTRACRQMDMDEYMHG